MSTLCLLEVTQLRTEAVDGRGAVQTKIKTRNKSNASFEAVQHRQDKRHIAHYHNIKNLPCLYTLLRISE